jgi:hypothetical protein
MLKIQCCNEKCTAAGRVFPWDEQPHLQSDGKLSKKEDDGAVSFVERCPSCGTRNKFYVTKVRETEVTRKMV